MILASAHVSSAFSQRVEVVVLAVVVCVLIFELIRRKRLMERYALLWLIAGITVLVLGLWQGLLTTLSHAVGIYYPPSALFAVAFVFVLVMLIHFSMTVSRLSDQNTILAQRLALLQERLDEQATKPTQPDSKDRRSEDALSRPDAPVERSHEKSTEARQAQGALGPQD